MFSFKLPRGAALSVSLPTGGAASFVHVGDGRFVSSVPPIQIDGVRPEGEGGEDMLPVTWDAEFLPAGTSVQAVKFGFDVPGAAGAVEAAAAAGDPHAQHIVGLMKQAEDMIAARAALLNVAAIAGTVAGDTDPVDVAAAAGA
jgi:hypothetical protein